MTGPPRDAPEDDGRRVEEMSYAEASAELDEIVRFFEQRDLDVDQLVGRLVRATAIVEELDRRLRRTRMQVEQLVPRLSDVVSGEGSGDGPNGADQEAADEHGERDERDAPGSALF